MPKNRFTILGSGTSMGVPTIGCECPTCISDDIRDKRLRCSLLIESSNANIVIDTSSDFRQQMLQNKIMNLDAVIYTHHHFDHIGGFDDIRAYNFILQKPISIYSNKVTLINLKRIFDYAFTTPEQIGGGVPEIITNLIDSKPFTINGLEIIPIKLMHGNLEVLGFRIGDFAYCTDTNFIPSSSMELLKYLKVLVIDGLRIEKHATHFNIEDSIEIIKLLKPQQAYLTHISHDIKHSEVEKELPENVFIAYDGIQFVV